MKNDILIELAKRWEHEAEPPSDRQAYPDGEGGARLCGQHTGERETLRRCADTIRTLVNMFPDRSEN